MENLKVLDHIISSKNKSRKTISLLIDPDKHSFESLALLIEKINSSVIDYVMVGGSLLSTDEMDEFLAMLKINCSKPLIIFPGSIHQVSKNADAILFLSLISGRNPEFLIGSQVVAAPLIKKAKLEVISTGYMLIDSGVQTTVSYISNTTPIPRNKTDIAVATAMASEMLGHQILYLDGGSGAKYEVPSEMISAVAKHTSIPLIIGGGINSVEKIKIAFTSGADMVVIGTAFEKDPEFLNQLNLEMAN